MDLRRAAWWVAVPVGVALGLALALGLDRAAAPASAQADGSPIAFSLDQLRINQRIAQAGVRRSNRANERLDRLTGTGDGPGPAGPAGPAGGVEASRIAFSEAVGAPTRTILDVAGLTLSVGCEAGPNPGEVSLPITARVTGPTTFIGTSNVDGGDPQNPSQAGSTNFQNSLTPGQANPLGGPSAVDGEFARSVGVVIFVMPSRTVTLNIAVVADAAEDRCSFNGMAVPS